MSNFNRMTNQELRTALIELMHEYVSRMDDESAYYESGWIEVGPPDGCTHEDAEYIASNRKEFTSCADMFGRIVKEFNDELYHNREDYELEKER